MEFWEGSFLEERFEEAQRSKDYLARGVFAKKWDPLGIFRDDTPEQAPPGYESAIDEMRKEKKAVSWGVSFVKYEGYISHCHEFPASENLDGNVSSKRLSGICEALETFEQINRDSGIHPPTPFINEYRDFMIQEPGGTGTFSVTPEEWLHAGAFWPTSLFHARRTSVPPNGQHFIKPKEHDQSTPVLCPVRYPDEALFAPEESPDDSSGAFGKVAATTDFLELKNKNKSWIWIGHMERESGGFVGGNRPGDISTAESLKPIPSMFSYYHTGPEPYYDAEIQNPTDTSRFIWEDSVRNTLLLDLAVQPGLAKTYTILFRNLFSRTLRKALEKVRSKLSGGRNIVCNALDFFKSASKLAVGMFLFGDTRAVRAVRAMAPEAAEPGLLQAEDFEKWSNFWFGLVACVGTFVAIIALLKSFNWRRRHSIAGTSAASAPAGAILNRAVNMAQTHTVLRSWRETEFREVVVALREEEGAYAS